MAEVTQAQSVDEGTWCWRDAQTRRSWVFGMRWFPSLGNKGRRHLYRNLRHQGFAWAVTHGKTLSLVGVQPLAASNKVLRHGLSAAAAFACAHPQGVHALCLEVTGVGVWFVAASQGCVLSETDRWFDTLEQAQMALQPLRERYDPMSYEHVVWSLVADASDPAASDSSVVRPSVPDFLKAKPRRDCQFHKLPAAQAAWPLWLAMGCLGAATLLVVHRLWLVPLTPKAPETSTARAPVQPLMIRVHSSEALKAVFEAWHPLPVDPAGWVLTGVRCELTGQTLACQAAYERKQPGADNMGLAKHTPKPWQFEPQSLDHAHLRRHVALPLIAKQPHVIATTNQGLTRLQQLSPQFASIAVGPERVVQSAALVTRSLTLRFSLRQVKRLLRLDLPVRWKQVDLTLVQGAQIDEKQGYLMVTMQGDWIARAHKAELAPRHKDDPVQWQTSSMTHLQGEAHEFEQHHVYR